MLEEPIKKDGTQTTDAGISGKDGKSAGSQADSKADAVALQIKELLEANKLLKTQIEDAQKKDDERKQKKLAEEGKYKELLDEQKKAQTALEEKLARSQRQSDLLMAVTAYDTTIPKAGLIDLVKWVDHDTGGEKKIEDVIKIAIEKAASFAPTNGAGETKAFGASGASRGTGDTTAKQAFDALVELGKKAAKGRDSNDRQRFAVALNEYRKAHGNPPKNLSDLIAA